MKRLFVLMISVSALGSSASILAQETSVAEEQRIDRVSLMTAPGTQDTSFVWTFVRSPEELYELQVSFDAEPWQPAVLSDEKGAGDYIYRMRMRRALFGGRKIEALGRYDDGEWFLVTAQLNSDGSAKVTKRQSGTKADFQRQEPVQVKQEQPTITQNPAASPVGGDPYGFLPILNRYRASLGLRPCRYDASLTSIAAKNNRMGGYHRYTGNTAQIWAMGSGTASGSFNQWRNSPGHNRIMKGASYSRVGIHFDGRNWTANFR